MSMPSDAKQSASASQSSLEATGTFQAPAGGAAATGSQPQLNTKPLFKLMVERKASDLFFTCNAPIKIKIEGQIFPVNKQVLSPETVRQTALALMTAEQRERFLSEFEIDFAISEPGLGRFRVNVFLQRGYPAVVLRYITADMPRLDSLALPDTIADLAMLKRGLILVVGATGSGKSTTLAAMINLRNETASDHIITIEDPIEFLHTNKRSIINQREVGLDTKSYARALRGAMRAAPDVILIGEVRDRESMEAAINLAGTGHLVMATLHANNCAETMDRIINMFPREQHTQIFLDLSQYLRAIMAQRLVMGKDNRRVAAMEVMLNTPHISELVKKGDVIGMKEAISASSERGIQSFDVALHRLFKEGRVEMAEALANADSRANLEAKINFG
ncbi:MAG TPA: PilT/PilU family type 4a pilus ATPase [Steroidobacteraceae bacterium]|jgi:twitching motility protein PilU|nr:PilT/PilU family type 4a pilus ATPase [Steroidobacteraceae bacterium]